MEQTKRYRYSTVLFRHTNRMLQYILFLYVFRYKNHVHNIYKNVQTCISDNTQNSLPCPVLFPHCCLSLPHHTLQEFRSRSWIQKLALPDAGPHDRVEVPAHEDLFAVAAGFQFAQELKVVGIQGVDSGNLTNGKGDWWIRTDCVSPSHRPGPLDVRLWLADLQAC